MNIEQLDIADVMNLVLDSYPGLFDISEAYMEAKDILGVRFANTKITPDTLLFTIAPYYKNKDWFVFEIESAVWHHFDTNEIKMELLVDTKSCSVSEGILNMSSDWLDDKSCVDLFEHNITILYKEDGVTVAYDKQAIMRKHTLANILSDD